MLLRSGITVSGMFTEGQHIPLTEMISISCSDILVFQYLSGACQKSSNTCALPLFFAPEDEGALDDDADADDLNLFKKSENDFWSSGGAKGCGC